jgi:hypothetical protein
MPLASPSTILVWAHSDEYGREVGITCDLIHLPYGVHTYHAHATSGVAYPIDPIDAAALLRIVRPAIDALAHPIAPPTARQSDATH